VVRSDWSLAAGTMPRHDARDGASPRRTESVTVLTHEHRIRSFCIRADLAGKRIMTSCRCVHRARARVVRPGSDTPRSDVLRVECRWDYRRLRGPQFTGAMAIFELSAGAALEEVPPFALAVQRGVPVDERLVAPGTEQLRRRFRAGREPGLPLERRHKLMPEASAGRERSWRVDRDTRR
jgi:hypothetical protein